MEQIVTSALLGFPYATGFLTAVGTLRLIMKPTMSILNTITKATPSKRDDQLLMKVQNSKTFSVFSYVIDWLTSIKVQSRR